jgi:hypothetical protein
MKLKKKVIQRINNPVDRTRIAIAIGTGEQAVSVAIRNNAQHGPLTKFAALEAIASITGLDMPDLIERKGKTATNSNLVA